MKNSEHLEKCGILAIFMMLITGTVFGVLGVVVAHVLMKYYENYYLILVFPILMALLLGFGLSLGAKLGRCSRVKFMAFLVVLFFSVICYAALNFLNYYYDIQDPKPSTILDEGLWLAEETQNFLGNLPYVSDYIKPVESSKRGNIIDKAVEFAETLPDQMQKQLVIGATVLDPLKKYLQYPKTFKLTDESFAEMQNAQEFPADIFTQLKDLKEQAYPDEQSFFNALQTKLTQEHYDQFSPLLLKYAVYHRITFWDDENKQLVLSKDIAKIWMLWVTEFIFVFLVALLMTRRGTKKVYQKRRAQFGVTSVERAQTKAAKEKKRKKKGAPEPQYAQLDLTPKQPVEEAPVEQPEPKPEKKGFSLFRRKEKAEVPPEAETLQEPVKEKEKRKWFGRKEKEPEVQAEAEAEPETAPAEAMPKMEFPAEQPEVKYALILHQYSSSRESDLIRLIQQVGQVQEDKARRLLKVPSLIKRDVSPQEASIAVEKFKQVQAQVKLITMEQFLELQKKQRQSVQPLPAAPQPFAPQSQSALDEHAQYALILRKFDPSQRKSVLELLSSLSGTPVAQLQQTLKTPALVLRDASEDEVMMISQQFQTIQAEVKILTMTDLQKLMAKK